MRANEHRPDELTATDHASPKPWGTDLGALDLDARARAEDALAFDPSG